MSKRPVRQRLDGDGQQVEVIIGLQDIHVFLEHIKAIVSENTADLLPDINKNEGPEANNDWVDIWKAVGMHINFMNLVSYLHKIVQKKESSPSLDGMILR